jgi:hypothetical protein
MIDHDVNIREGAPATLSLGQALQPVDKPMLSDIDHHHFNCLYSYFLQPLQHSCQYHWIPHLPKYRPSKKSTTVNVTVAFIHAAKAARWEVKAVLCLIPPAGGRLSDALPACSGGYSRLTSI